MKEVKYKKICFDERINRFIVELRGKDEEGKKAFYNGNFPLDKFLDTEEFSLLKDDVFSIYVEDPPGIFTKQYLDGKEEPLTEEEAAICSNFANKATTGAYDEFNKPPSTDEQVQKFIEEFFEEVEDEPIQQRDLLAEFFAELEEEEESKE